MVKITPPLSKQPIPPQAKRVFGGIIFDVYQWEQKLFDGTTKTFEKLKRPATVMVLPVIDDKILLTEQEQPGVQPFIGAIGGIQDKGEGPLETAKRELFEEAGYEARDWKLWQAVQMVDKIDWVAYTFIARGLLQKPMMNPDTGEKITLKWVSFEEFVDLVADERFRDVEISLAVLRAYKQNKLEDLRKVLFY